MKSFEFLIIVLLSLVMVTPIAIAAHLEYPYYLDTSEPETVRYHNAICSESNITYWLYFEDSKEKMNCTNDDTASIDLISQDEVNLDVTVWGYNTTLMEYNHPNSTDNLTTRMIYNDSMYAVNQTMDFNTSLDNEFFTCFAVNSSEQTDLSIRFGGREQNTSEYLVSDTYTRTIDPGLQSVCANDVVEANTTYGAGRKENFSVYAGLSCPDCFENNSQDRKGFGLLVDSPAATNQSVVFSNGTFNDSRRYDADIAMDSVFTLTQNAGELDTGVLQFKEPYNLTFELFSGLNSTSEPEPYLNEFQYVVLTPAEPQNDGTFDTRFMDSSKLNSFLDFGITPDIYPDDEEMDTNLAFWGSYEDGSGQIKMYENGTYTLGLITTKYKKTIDWPYEFRYPQNEGTSYYSDIVDITFRNETDQDVTVYADQIEISWFRFLMNLGLNFGIFLLWVGSIIAIRWFFDSPKIAGTFATLSFFVMIRLMGLI